MSAAGRRRAESAVGHLVGTAVVSALVWWLLSAFTSLPDGAALWLSGLAAGWSSLPALRRTAAYLNPAPTPRPRKTP
uniref:hypothetical protein n=1 Tax=Sphaerisporangium sp. CA-236357 TaxID=3240030 RepID=UPI003F49151C